MSALGLSNLSVQAPAYMPMVEPLRKRLEQRRKDAQELVEALDKALKFMDENPNFEAFHDIVGKVSF